MIRLADTSGDLCLSRPRWNGSRIRENPEAGRSFSPKSHDFGYNEIASAITPGSVDESRITF